MTDHFETDARIDDRMLALARTLLDPNLNRETKWSELANAFDRINRLEDQRPMAAHLSVIADTLDPLCPRCGDPGHMGGDGRLWCRNVGCSFVFPFGDAA